MPADDGDAPEQPGSPSPRGRLSWRRLGAAWGTLALLVAMGAGALQWLGAPQDGARTPAEPQKAPTRNAAVPGDVVPQGVQARADAAARQGAADTAPAQAATEPPVLHPSGGSRDRQAPAQGASGSSAPDAPAANQASGQAAAAQAAAAQAPAAQAAAAQAPAAQAATAQPGPAPAEHPAPPGPRTAAAPAVGTASSTGAAGSAAAGVPDANTGAARSVANGSLAPQVAGAGGADPGGAGPATDRTAAVGVARPAAPPAQGVDTSEIIAAPIAALLEPAADGLALPRIGADGLAPMQAYARPFAAPPGARLVAIVVDGIGLSEADSQAAINVLPGAIDLAVSPYAPHPEPLLRQARLKGHELLASIPMEPAGAPLNDEGGRALSLDATPEANAANLDQVLGRIQGYVGATGGSDGQRGEHFALSGRPFALVAEQLAARGLLYVDTAGARVPSGLASRGVDLVVDEPAGAAALDARLARLEAIAQENGAALGLAGPPRPVMVERLAAWAKGLAARGFVLAPVSALVREARPAASGAGPGAAAAGVASTAAPAATAAHGQPMVGPAGPAASPARRVP